jgi:hypothetical protein
MVWDGDTIPCRNIKMFQEESGKPYLDMKHEYHQEYFETLGIILPGFRKVIERSFISEHMLIRADIMRALIAEIEANTNLPGTRFWEKIINAIAPEKIQSSAFSEFETYGTFVALRFQDVYKLREWHSFRQGGTFFSIDTICDRDFKWLSQDFDAISFEKGHEVREDNGNLFDNPYYQEKLTPKQMLQAAQMEYKEGYKEVWGDDENIASANTTSGSFPDEKIADKNNDKKMNTGEILESFRRSLESNPEFLDEMPASDIVSCVYVELYGLRQLYDKAHFEKLESQLQRYSDILLSSQETGDVEQADEILGLLMDFENALPDSEVALNFIETANFEHAYLRHIAEETTVVIGDSHVGFFSGNEELSFISMGRDINTCEQVNGLPLTVLHLGPCLAYKSNQYGSTTGFREKLDFLMSNFILEGAKIICSLGEIDLRAHVFKQTSLQGKGYEEIVDGILSNYFEFLLWLKSRGFRVYCWGPIASQKDSAPNTPEHPRVGSETDRNRATAYFNNRLKAFCCENEIGFMTIFDKMINESFETNEDYLSKDRFHLGQYAFEESRKQLIEQGLFTA